MDFAKVQFLLKDLLGPLHYLLYHIRTVLISYIMVLILGSISTSLSRVCLQGLCTGCGSLNENPTKFKIVKEPLLIQK